MDEKDLLTEKEPVDPAGDGEDLDSDISDILNWYKENKGASDVEEDDAMDEDPEEDGEDPEEMADEDDFWDDQNEDSEDDMDEVGDDDPAISQDTEDTETAPDLSGEADASVSDLPSEEPAPEKPTAKTFTQDEVNRLVGDARKQGRESVLKSLRDNYGLESLDGLGDIYGKSQQFDYVNGEYQNAMKELGELKTQDMLRKANVNPSKVDDIKFYFKGKGLPITEESLQDEIEKHPEWMSQDNTSLSANSATAGKSTVGNIIKKFNGDINNQEPSSNIVKETVADPFSNNKQDGISEKDKMKQMFYGQGGF